MEHNNAFLGTAPIGKLMRGYALPCIISLLVGALYIKYYRPDFHRERQLPRLLPARSSFPSPLWRSPSRRF